MISWVRWISHIQTHTHTHTCLTVKIFKKPWFHFISRRMCRVQQITSTFSHCKKEVNIFFMDCWVSFAPADLGHGWGNHCTCSLRLWKRHSSRIGQMSWWSLVVQIRRLGSHPPRLSRKNSHVGCGFVCIDTNICLWLMCTNALWLIVYIFLYLHTDDYTKNMIIFTLYTL